MDSIALQTGRLSLQEPATLPVRAHQALVRGIHPNTDARPAVPRGGLGYGPFLPRPQHLMPHTHASAYVLGFPTAAYPPSFYVSALLPQPEPQQAPAGAAQLASDPPGQEEVGSQGCNVFIRGLRPDATDDTLRHLCEPYGAMASAKAILDKESNNCKGYGFVLFETPESAAAAIKAIKDNGQLEAAYAKLANSLSPEPPKDPTNLYFSNLPVTYGDKELQDMLQPHGHVISSRILRDLSSGSSRGVAFARMESAQVCEAIIELFNGKQLEGAAEPLICKLADAPHARRREKARPATHANPAQVYRPVMPLVYSDLVPESQVVPSLYPPVVFDGRGHAGQIAQMPLMAPQFYPPMYSQLVYATPQLYPMPSHFG